MCPKNLLNMSIYEILMSSWYADKINVLSQQSKGSYQKLNKFIKVMKFNPQRSLSNILICIHQEDDTEKFISLYL